MTDEAKIRECYTRLCTDANFGMDAIEAAKFTGRLFGVHPLEVAAAFPNIDAMKEVACGTHPAIQKVKL